MPDATNTLAPLPPVQVNRQLARGVFDDASSFDQAQRVALCLTSSTMVPERYRGETNIGNAMIAIDIAARLQMPPLMVMQHLYIVYGTPAWSGQMVTALVNGSGLFRDPLAFEFKDEDKKADAWGCRCTAVLKSTGARINGPWVDIAMAKAEGWYNKKDSKWQTIPEMMLRYRAAAYFGRTQCPEVTIGLRTRDEAEDTGPEETLPGPFIDVPNIGDGAQATPTTPTSQAPQTVKRTRAAKTAAPVETKPEPKAETPAASAATTPTAPVPPEVPPQPVPPPVQPVMKQEPPAAPKAAEAPPAPPVDGRPPHIQLAERLQADGISVDDTFDFIENTGLAYRHKVNIEKIESFDQLPEDLLYELMGDKLYPGLKKTFGPRK